MCCYAYLEIAVLNKFISLAACVLYHETLRSLGAISCHRILGWLSPVWVCPILPRVQFHPHG